MYGGHIRAFLNNLLLAYTHLVLFALLFPFNVFLFYTCLLSLSSFSSAHSKVSFSLPVSLSIPYPQSLTLSVSQIGEFKICSYNMFWKVTSAFAIPKWLSIFLSVYFDSKSKLLIETYPEAAKFTHRTYTPYTAHKHSYFGVSICI